MAKVRNYVLYPKTNEILYSLKQEYEWLGREVLVSEDKQGKKLVILALPKNSARKSRQEARLKAKRSERERYEDKYSGY